MEPSYKPVKDDGANWYCSECGEYGKAKDVWFISCPNGSKGIYHKNCIDTDWLKIATFINEAV